MRSTNFTRPVSRFPGSWIYCAATLIVWWQYGELPSLPVFAATVAASVLCSIILDRLFPEPSRSTESEAAASGQSGNPALALLIALYGATLAGFYFAAMLVHDGYVMMTCIYAVAFLLISAGVAMFRVLSLSPVARRNLVICLLIPMLPLLVRVYFLAQASKIGLPR